MTFVMTTLRLMHGVGCIVDFVTHVTLRRAVPLTPGKRPRAPPTPMELMNVAAVMTASLTAIKTLEDAKIHVMPSHVTTRTIRIVRPMKTEVMSAGAIRMMPGGLCKIDMILTTTNTAEDADG